MKRILLLINTLILSFTLSAQAQTQQGYVKTLGRPDKAGEPLGGVTIRAKGQHNPVLSDEQGIFTLQLTEMHNGDIYTLQQVQKSGYELNEADVIGKRQIFSDKVPLTLVMVSKEVIHTEKERIENNANRVAEKNFNSQLEQIKQQLRDSIITLAKYQHDINELQQKFESYQALIDGLAEHYAHTDYDFLDDKEREINLCIENGDLERADSLINTLFDPIGVLERNMEALASIEQQIAQAQGMIDQANEDMAAVLKQQENDAEYLYQLYTISLTRFDYEKALFYIETRAQLDTTNAEWQFDAASYFQDQNDFNRAERYYVKALEIRRRLAQGNPQAYEPDLAKTLNNLAILFYDSQRLTESEAIYMEALEIYRRFAQGNPQAYEPYVAKTLNNLALLYSKTQRLAESEAMFLKI